MVSSNGGKIAHHIEVEVSDPDGVSSVQAIIGRLADIGKSEQWLLLVDDGTSGDRVAGDGIYTLFFEASRQFPKVNWRSKSVPQTFLSHPLLLRIRDTYSPSNT